MKYFGPMLLTAALTTVALTVVAGAVQYHEVMKTYTFMSTDWVERPLTFPEALREVWSDTTDGLPVLVIVSIALTLSVLPVTVVSARRTRGLAYACAGVLGFVLGGLVTPLVAYLLVGSWVRPVPDLAWAPAWVSGAFCGITLTFLVRRMAARKTRAAAV